MTLNGKEYTLSFDNYALHEWGELCGFETFNRALEEFQGFAEVANGKDITLAQSKNLAKLCYIALGGKDSGLSEREVFNLTFENPELIQGSLVVALDALPKPHKEDKADKKKAQEVK